VACASVVAIRAHPGALAEGSRERSVARTSHLTIVRSSLLLPSRQGSQLLDITGRRVMDLLPGANDMRNVAPGVYFVRTAESGERSAVSVRKVVIQR
jgi:hypothetical protein